MLLEVDENSDGEISFKEFVEMMTKLAWKRSLFSRDDFFKFFVMLRILKNIIFNNLEIIKSLNEKNVHG